MEELLHNADNPLNLGALLNTGLKIAESKLAPATVPTSTQTAVLTTPGAQPQGQKQIDEKPTLGNRVKAFLPLILGVLGFGLVALAIWPRKKG